MSICDDGLFFEVSNKSVNLNLKNFFKIYHFQQCWRLIQWFILYNVCTIFMLKKKIRSVMLGIQLHILICFVHLLYEWKYFMLLCLVFLDNMYLYLHTQIHNIRGKKLPSTSSDIAKSSHIYYITRFFPRLNRPFDPLLS